MQCDFFSPRDYFVGSLDTELPTEELISKLQRGKKKREFI
jgi:hypothetical protein